MNTSRPRTFSMISMLTSPSLKRPTEARPTGSRRSRAISCASAGFAFPVNRASVSDSTIRVSLINTDHQCQSALAGVEGFEPPNGGIKTRCLTTWRHPSSHPASALPILHPQHRMHRRAIQSARDKTAPSIRHARRNALCILGPLEAREDARAGTRQMRPERHAVRIDLCAQPLEGLGHLRVARAYYRFERVNGAAFGKGAYCEDDRISCQFRGLEGLGGAHTATGMNHEKPARRQLQRTELLSAALSPGGTAMHEHRHVRSQRQAELRQLRHAQAATPECIEREQNAGRIRAAAAQTAPGRNMFNDLHIRPEPGAAMPLQRPSCAHRQVLVRLDLGRTGRTRDAAIRTHRKTNPVAAIDQLEDRLQLVIAILAAAGNLQKQVYFGRCRTPAQLTQGCHALTAASRRRRLAGAARRASR